MSRAILVSSSASCPPLFDPPSFPFSFRVVIICMEVEVFRVMNLPLACVRAGLLLLLLISPLMADHPHPALCLLLFSSSSSSSGRGNSGLMGSCGAEWRFQGWRPRREQL